MAFIKCELLQMYLVSYTIVQATMILDDFIYNPTGGTTTDNKKYVLPATCPTIPNVLYSAKSIKK